MNKKKDDNQSKGLTLNITVTAYDRNGREIKNGDIIESEYGVRTVVEFNPKLRQYIAVTKLHFQPICQRMTLPNTLKL